MIHAIFDITGCQHADAEPETIMIAMRQTADRLGCTTRAQVIEPFQPHGATCVLILAESHITVSTWPEHQLAHIDVFTCRADSEPGHAIQPILDLLAGQVTNTQNVLRTPPETAGLGNVRLLDISRGSGQGETSPGASSGSSSLLAQQPNIGLYVRSVALGGAVGGVR